LCFYGELKSIPPSQKKKKKKKSAFLEEIKPTTVKPKCRLFRQHFSHYHIRYSLENVNKI